MLQELIFHIYKNFYSQACDQHSQDIQQFLDTLHKSSKLSEKRKKFIPTKNQLETLSRNICWLVLNILFRKIFILTFFYRVIHYWKDCINIKPDASQDHNFGFFYNQTRKQYVWLDTSSDEQNEVVGDITRDPYPNICIPPNTQLHELQKAKDFIMQFY